MSTPALRHAIQLLGLHDPELVAIFKIRPVELAEWKRGAVPATQAAAVTALDDIAKRLAVWLDRAQLQSFVRQPRAEFGGRPLLQVLAEEGPEPVHAELDRLLAAGLLP
ncbi:MAG TPA: hypothetical protein VGQ42_03765 [Candidatus Dormibacteraeota bacterium]|nr:hypothetical protein [Candidatus Dormibacteraeota bacterium]